MVHIMSWSDQWGSLEGEKAKWKAHEKIRTLESLFSLHNFHNCYYIIISFSQHFCMFLRPWFSHASIRARWGQLPSRPFKADHSMRHAWRFYFPGLNGQLYPISITVYNDTKNFLTHVCTSFWGMPCPLQRFPYSLTSQSKHWGPAEKGSAKQDIWRNQVGTFLQKSYLATQVYYILATYDFSPSRFLWEKSWAHNKEYRNTLETAGGIFMSWFVPAHVGYPKHVFHIPHGFFSKGHSVLRKKNWYFWERVTQDLWWYHTGSLCANTINLCV